MRGPLRLDPRERPPQPAGEAIPPAPPPALPLPHHSTWLTRLLLAINLILFLLLSLLSRGSFMDAVLNGASGGALVLMGAKVNELIRAGQYWRLLTPIFLHIGLMHLLFNQYALLIFGIQVERWFGTARFAAIYFVAGLFGSLASFIFVPNIAAGASGAIFGIIGALAAYLLRNRDTLGEAGRANLRSLLGLIVINLFLGLTIPGIDNYAHMGGLLAGFLLGGALSPTYAVERLPAPPYARVIERPLPLDAPVVVALALALLVMGLRLAL